MHVSEHIVYTQSVSGARHLTAPRPLAQLYSFIYHLLSKKGVHICILSCVHLLAYHLRNETVQALKNVLSTIYPDQAVRRGRNPPAAPADPSAAAAGTDAVNESPSSVPDPSSEPAAGETSEPGEGEGEKSEPAEGEESEANPIPVSETHVPDDGEIRAAHEPAAAAAEEVAVELLSTSPSLTSSSPTDMMDTLPMQDAEWPPCPWVPKNSLDRWKRQKSQACF